MDFEKLRQDFTVYVVDTETSYCDLISEALKNVGYHVETYMKGEDVIEQIKAHPPHIVIFGTYLLGTTGLQLVKTVRDLSPDIQLIIMANYAESDIASEALALGAADRIFKPIQNIADVIAAVDRVTERRFLEFSNEALYKKLVTNQSAQRNLRRRFLKERTVLDLAKNLFEALSNSQDGSQSLQTLVDLCSQYGNKQALFFRYLPQQGNFLCTHSTYASLKGLQLNITLEAITQDENEAKDVLSVLLGKDHFFYRQVAPSGKVLGLLVLGSSVADPLLRRSLDYALQVFSLHYELFETRKTLHENLLRDELTGVWTRAEFDRRAIEEVSRARRLKNPLSMLYIGLDRMDEIKKQVGPLPLENAFKDLAKLLQSTSRITDIIGRYSEGELAVLLPHTDKLGAAIKAEKFRRLVEKTSFLPEAGIKFCVSVGVSEYPSLCMDAQTLWHSADSAYFQVKKLGNKVCLAAAPRGLEPDFEITR